MSNPAVAYTLTDEHDLATYGGTVHLRDGLSLNIGDALNEGGGLILTDDPLLVRTLDARPDLRRLEQPPAEAKITSHQLLDSDREAHRRDKSEVPSLALDAAGPSGLEIMAAQARGDLPIAVVPPNPDDPVEMAAAAALSRPPTMAPQAPPAGPDPSQRQAPAAPAAGGETPTGTAGETPTGPDPAAGAPRTAADRAAQQPPTTDTDTGSKN